jgi:prephenate dehydrogenase
VRLAFLGLGLIGGSVVRAVRANEALTNAAPGTAREPDSIVAWSPAGRGPAEALAGGVIDRVANSLASAIEGAELIVLAADPLTCLGLLDELARLPAADEPATITDVASTKTMLGRKADSLGLSYVGGHPLAGLELAGYGHGRADLFAGRPWVLCPGAHARPIDLERTEALVERCGATRHWLSAEAHDRAVAGISHLPLALAAALVESVGEADDWPLAAELAAGGWGSSTRLARGDVAMGAGIAATNAPELARRLRSARTHLDGWLADLEATPDDPAATAERIGRRLGAARQTLAGE